MRYPENQLLEITSKGERLLEELEADPDAYTGLVLDKQLKLKLLELLDSLGGLTDSDNIYAKIDQMQTTMVDTREVKPTPNLLKVKAVKVLDDLVHGGYIDRYRGEEF